MTLIATAGAATANSYVTVDEATDILLERLNITPWYDETPNVVAPYLTLQLRREAALITATRLLDELVTWAGWPTTETQALAWPQTGQVDRWGEPLSTTIIPAVIKRATAIYALALLRDTTETSSGSVQTGGIKRQRLGSKEIEYFPSTTGNAGQSVATSGVPAEVRQMLAGFGMMPGGMTVRLVRT